MNGDFSDGDRYSENQDFVWIQTEGLWVFAPEEDE